MNTTTPAPTATTPPPATKSFARHIPTIARVLLGLMFFVFGLNHFLNFIPPPKEMPPEKAMAFAMALMNTGYMMPLIKGVETLCGLLLLVNRFVPLALVLLAPVIVNIVAFHLFLAPSGAAMVIVILGLELYLAWAYRAAYRPLLTARATPA
jgi:uncharacterized membrane protein YphA (DoxX/SURF4 family)